MIRFISLVLFIALHVSTSLATDYIHRAPDDFLRSWVEGPIRLGAQNDLTLGIPDESSLLRLRHTRLIPATEVSSANQPSSSIEAWRDYYTIQPRTDTPGFLVSLFRDGAWKEVGKLPDSVLSDSEWFDGALYFLMRPSKSLPTSTHLYRSQVTPSGTITPPALVVLAPAGMVLEKFAVTRDGLYGVARGVGDERRVLLNLRGLDSHSPGWSECGEVRIPSDKEWDITSRGSHLVLCSPSYRDIEICGTPREGEAARWEHKRLDQGPWQEVLSRTIDSLEANAGISPRIIHQFSLPQTAEVAGVRMGWMGQTPPRLRWRVANAATEVYSDWSGFAKDAYVPIGEPAQYVQYEIRPPADDSPVGINEVALVLGQPLGTPDSVNETLKNNKLSLAKTLSSEDPTQAKIPTLDGSFQMSSLEVAQSAASKEGSSQKERWISGGASSQTGPIPTDEVGPANNGNGDATQTVDSSVTTKAITPASGISSGASERNASGTNPISEGPQILGETDLNDGSSEGNPQPIDETVADSDSSNGQMEGNSGIEPESDFYPALQKTSGTETGETAQPFASSADQVAQSGRLTADSGTELAGKGGDESESGESGPTGGSAPEDSDGENGPSGTSADGEAAGENGPSGESVPGDAMGERGPEGDSVTGDPTGTDGQAGDSAEADDNTSGTNSSQKGEEAGNEISMADDSSHQSAPVPSDAENVSSSPAQNAIDQAGEGDESGKSQKAGEVTSFQEDSKSSMPFRDESGHSSSGVSIAKGVSGSSLLGAASNSRSHVSPLRPKTGSQKKVIPNAPTFIEKVAANLLIPSLLALVMAILAASALQELRGRKQSGLPPYLQSSLSPRGWEEQKRVEISHANQLAATSTLVPGSTNQALAIPALPVLPEREKGKIEWHAAEPLPRPMAPATAFYHHGAVYVVDPHGTICQARLRADGSLCPWGVRVGRLPSRSAKGVAAFVDPHIVCISGDEISVARIDGENIGEWRLAGRVEGLREVTAAVGMGNRLFFVGGGSKGNPFPTVRSVEIDSHGRLGKVCCHPPLPLGVTDGTLVAGENCLYWIGGMCQHKVSRKVFSAHLGMDLQFEEWRVEADLPWGQRHPTAEAWGGALWIVLNKPMGDESVVFKGERNGNGAVKHWEATGQQFPEPVHAASLPFVAGRFFLLGGWMKAEGSVPRTEVLAWNPALTR